MPDNRPAVLFDVDGTLVDTNWFHTLAWWRGLRSAGEQVPMSRIHPLIGMGSEALLEQLMGEPRPDLKEAHTREFDRVIDEIVAFHGAADLLRAVHGRGGRVALCTSAKQAHLEPMRKALDAEDAIEVVVDADDVEQAKPAPDVFAVGLEKLNVSPDRSIAVGDTRWDVEAASKLGIPTVCVLTGGAVKEHLLDVGAVAVYEDVADLLAHLDDSPVGKLISK